MPNLVVTGRVELNREPNPTPPPARVTTVTIRPERDGENPVTFENLSADDLAVFLGNAGCRARVEFSPGPPPALAAVKVW